jgi:hypothetical protein
MTKNRTTPAYLAMLHCHRNDHPLFLTADKGAALREARAACLRPPPTDSWPVLTSVITFRGGAPVRRDLAGDVADGWRPRSRPGAPGNGPRAYVVFLDCLEATIPLFLTEDKEVARRQADAYFGNLDGAIKRVNGMANDWGIGEMWGVYVGVFVGGRPAGNGDGGGGFEDEGWDAYRGSVAEAPPDHRSRSRGGRRRVLPFRPDDNDPDY